jgi:hypothetical protein
MSWDTVANMSQLMMVVVGTLSRVSGGVPHRLDNVVNYPDFNLRTWENE